MAGRSNPPSVPNQFADPSQDPTGLSSSFAAIVQDIQNFQMATYVEEPEETEAMEETEAEVEGKGKKRKRDEEGDDEAGEEEVVKELDPSETNLEKIGAYFMARKALRPHTRKGNPVERYLTKIFLHWGLDLTKRNVVTDLFFNTGKDILWPLNVIINLSKLVMSVPQNFRNSIIRELKVVLREKKTYAKNSSQTNMERLAYNDIYALEVCIRRGFVVLQADLPEDQIDPGNNNSAAG